MTTRLFVKTITCEALLDVVCDELSITHIKVIGAIDKQCSLIEPDPLSMAILEDAVASHLGIIS